jgi:hypothetical protein
MTCLSCAPPIGNAVRRSAATPARRSADAIRRAWRAYWVCRARQAIDLLLRALDERCLRELGIDHSEVRPLLQDGSQRCRRLG